MAERLMIRHLSAFLLMCILPGVALCGIGGDADNRKVIGWIGARPSYISAGTVNQWNKEPYNNVVKITRPSSTYPGLLGTGGIISPKHILTNAHVANGCGTGKEPDCIVKMSDGTSRSAKVVAYGGTKPTMTELERQNTPNQYDWSVLEIVDKNFCAKHWFEYVKPTSQTNGLWRAGFGSLRKLEQKDIALIKSIYQEAITEGYKVHYNGDEAKAKKATAQWIKGKGYFFPDDIMKSFQVMYRLETNSDFIKDYLSDTDTLKLSANCAITSIEYKKGERIARHNCQSWKGDSGSAIIESGAKIISMNGEGLPRITSYDASINSSVLTQDIFNNDVENIINKAKKACNSNYSTSKKSE